MTTNTEPAQARIDKPETGIDGLVTLISGGRPEGRTGLVPGTAGGPETASPAQFPAEEIRSFGESAQDRPRIPGRGRHGRSPHPDSGIDQRFPTAADGPRQHNGTGKSDQCQEPSRFRQWTDVNHEHEEDAGLFASTISTSSGGTSNTEAHISTITDSSILLRHVKVYDEMRRGVTVLKMRDSVHDKDIRELSIDAGGKHLEKPSHNVAGYTLDIRSM